MNKAQKDRAVRVIQNDANLTGKHYDPNTKRTCVIGGLLQDCGFPMKHLPSRSQGILAAELKPAREVLFRHFGLTDSELRELQSINDGVYDLEPRRSKLISKLNEWVES